MNERNQQIFFANRKRRFFRRFLKEFCLKLFGQVPFCIHNPMNFNNPFFFQHGIEHIVPFHWQHTIFRRQRFHGSVYRKRIGKFTEALDGCFHGRKDSQRGRRSMELVCNIQHKVVNIFSCCWQIQQPIWLIHKQTRLQAAFSIRKKPPYGRIAVR